MNIDQGSPELSPVTNNGPSADWEQISTQAESFDFAGEYLQSTFKPLDFSRNEYKMQTPSSSKNMPGWTGSKTEWPTEEQDSNNFTPFSPYDKTNQWEEGTSSQQGQANSQDCSAFDPFEASVVCHFVNYDSDSDSSDSSDDDDDEEDEIVGPVPYEEYRLQGKSKGTWIATVLECIDAQKQKNMMTKSHKKKESPKKKTSKHEHGKSTKSFNSSQSSLDQSKAPKAKSTKHSSKKGVHSVEKNNRQTSKTRIMTLSDEDTDDDNMPNKGESNIAHWMKKRSNKDADMKYLHETNSKDNCMKESDLTSVTSATSRSGDSSFFAADGKINVSLLEDSPRKNRVQSPVTRTRSGDRRTLRRASSTRMFSFNNNKNEKSAMEKATARRSLVAQPLSKSQLEYLTNLDDSLDDEEHYSPPQRREKVMSRRSLIVNPVSRSHIGSDRGSGRNLRRSTSSRNISISEENTPSFREKAKTRRSLVIDPVSSLQSVTAQNMRKAVQDLVISDDEDEQKPVLIEKASSPRKVPSRKSLIVTRTRSDNGRTLRRTSSNRNLSFKQDGSMSSMDSDSSGQKQSRRRASSRKSFVSKNKPKQQSSKTDIASTAPSPVTRSTSTGSNSGSNNNNGKIIKRRSSKCMMPSPRHLPSAGHDSDTSASSSNLVKHSSSKWSRLVQQNNKKQNNNPKTTKQKINASSQEEFSEFGSEEFSVVDFTDEDDQKLQDLLCSQYDNQSSDDDDEAIWNTVQHFNKLNAN